MSGGTNKHKHKLKVGEEAAATSPAILCARMNRLQWPIYSGCKQTWGQHGGDSRDTTRACESPPPPVEARPRQTLPLSSSEHGGSPQLSSYHRGAPQPWRSATTWGWQVRGQMGVGADRLPCHEPPPTRSSVRVCSNFLTGHVHPRLQGAIFFALSSIHSSPTLPPIKQMFAEPFLLDLEVGSRQQDRPGICLHRAHSVQCLRRTQSWTWRPGHCPVHGAPIPRSPDLPAPPLPSLLLQTPDSVSPGTLVELARVPPPIYMWHTPRSPPNLGPSTAGPCPWQSSALCTLGRGGDPALGSSPWGSASPPPFHPFCVLRTSRPLTSLATIPPGSPSHSMPDFSLPATLACFNQSLTF